MVKPEALPRVLLQFCDPEGRISLSHIPSYARVFVSHLFRENLVKMKMNIATQTVL